MTAEPQALASDRRDRRDFRITSVSAAGRWNIGQAMHVGLGLDRAQRAPTSEELYSNGYHAATGHFEVGSDRLRPETADRAELGLHWHRGRLAFAVSAYRTEYRDFLYQSAVAAAPTPQGAGAGLAVLIEGGAPVYLWTQGDARFTGGEVDATIALTGDPENAWDLHLFCLLYTSPSPRD